MILIPYLARGMLAILITHLILLTILLAEFIQTYNGFFCSVTQPLVRNIFVTVIV